MRIRKIGKLEDGKGNVYPILRMPREWIDLIGKNVTLERTMVNGHEVIVIYTNPLSLYRSGQNESSVSSQYNWRNGVFSQNSIQNDISQCWVDDTGREECWRRGRDLNPGGLNAHGLSRPAPSQARLPRR